MKKILLLMVLLSSFCAFSQAQSAIGKTTIEGAGILDFKANTKLGIVLPRVLSTTSVVTPGTLFYDATAKKVMFKDNSGFKDLSINTGTFVAAADYVNLINTNDVTIIGASSSTATGVLILEAGDKALILPKVASPHLNIVKPEAGTICYDTDKDLFCVFNGTEWTFWGE